MRRAYPGKVNAARTQGRAEVLPRRGATRRLLALVVDLRGIARVPTTSGWTQDGPDAGASGPSSDLGPASRGGWVPVARL